MTDWLRIVDRGISVRTEDGDPPVFTVNEISAQLAAAIDENESDPEKRKLMNLCFDALVCLRELNARLGR